jgi:hypothetical protein
LTGELIARRHFSRNSNERKINISLIVGCSGEHAVFISRLLPEWNESLIVLVLPLPGKKIIETAMLLFRVGTTKRWTTLVDGAATGFLIEEAADALADGILAVAKHAVAIILDVAREATLGDLVCQIKMLCEPRNIPFGDQNPFIGAAVAWTLRAVILWRGLRGRQDWQRFFGHGVASSGG